ncbi:hypothetical protein K488DRAFT_71204 [Vararia minispora EC-137]|uniref:Uncharacterized protein n=1 Tax=Vararia minispora EC-137 TaxID=1314806 RepID=A0ACB8QJ72_9AGAM|nr:hypothetical protein K488DRAFT_71204 [Vararia minispora EC-137]
MSSIKLNAASISLQSKSSVLTGVQDAYWSDEEVRIVLILPEAEECPLCLEEMDVSDLNFKPCPCGYQICRFCWHHIRENLNNKCPACRREYFDENIQNKPVSREDQRRLAQQKKQRERERKDLDALGRRHLANVRVVQRNLISTLRSNDYFGQYGRISKIVLVKRTPPGGQAPVVGLYITYHRREDAARCITAVDGTASPGGGNEVMRASYGTTKYCMSFLRGVSCSDHSCMNLHEWGDEKDCFTKEDLTTLQHAIKDSEVTRKTVVLGKKTDDSSTRLPRSASWAKNPPATTAGTPLHNHTNTSAPHARQSRRDRGGEKSSRGSRAATSTAHDPPDMHPASWKNKDSRSTQAPKATTATTSNSRPSTPASAPRPTTPALALAKPKRKVYSPPPPPPPKSPTSSVTQESDVGSGSGFHDVPTPADSPAPATPAIPPGLPAVPPGLAAPPGLPPPGSRGQQGQSYQMSSQVQALLNDVKARRESAPIVTGVSPFPDLDRTLQTLSEANGFSFNLDPKLAPTAEEADSVEADAGAPFVGSFMDAFPALRSAAASPMLGPPGIAYPHNPARSIYDPLAARHSPAPTSPTLSYTGSFDPFAESLDDAAATAARRAALEDGPPKMSRFGFARNGRQGGLSSSTSSPRVGAAPLSSSASLDSSVGATNGSLYEQWNAYSLQHHPFQSHTSSPLAQHAQAYAPVQPPSQQRFQQQQYSSQDVISEATLRELIASSRVQEQQRMRVAAVADQEQQQGQYRFNMNAGFSDPAIMSASISTSFTPEARYPAHSLDSFQQFNGAHTGIPHPPPGLSPAPDMAAHVPSARAIARSPSPFAVSSSPLLSPSEFPALTAQPPQPSTITTSAPPPAPDGEDSVTDKDAKRAAKRAAAAARAAERREAREAKERERAERKAEREREAEAGRERKREEERVKAEKDKVEKEEREKKERMAYEKAEAEKAERLAKEKARAEKAAKEAQARETAKAEAARKKAGAAATATRVPVSTSKTNLAAPASSAPKPESQGPLLSKMPKKNKPVTKHIRVPKEDEVAADINSVAASMATDTSAASAHSGASTTDSTSLKSSSRGQSVEHELVPESSPTSVTELLAQIQASHPDMDLAHHAFFDSARFNPPGKMPLEYGPLVHALSALSVGGGSFASSMPPGSIDHAVSSFQQLLETLTQTISDLLRLLPRTTWDDSSSFDGVLRDMLKGDDFLDLDNPDAAVAHTTIPPLTAPTPAPGAGKDEVATLTLALERRARWMEVQLCKLEELHRDINTAAVRAVLAFNDSGWDAHGFTPRAGNTLQKFDALGLVDDGAGGLRQMNADELDKKLAVAREAAVFAEVEMKEMMQKMQVLRPATDF